MNQNLERALLLYQQSRHELAEKELRQALAADPRHSFAHALLALCLAQRQQFQEATAEAQQAIHLEPDLPFAYYAHAKVFFDRDRYPDAQSAIEEAIRLDASDPDYFSLLSSIHLQRHKWQDALHAAEQGLELDPEHVGCTNQRAIAMVKLGRKAEAGATIDAALAKQPESSVTHANQGWTLLHKGDHKKALEHFREALRLDPENEWARLGIIEALKARNIVYALMLKYFLWMSRFSPRAQWAIILGGYFGNRLLGAVASANPRLALWVLPIRILYVVFALMTWMAYPFFNLLLRADKFGRMVLSREESVASNWFGWCLFAALISLAGCIIFGFDSPWLISAAVFAFLLLPVSSVFRCAPGWPRNVMAALSILLALLGFAAIASAANLSDSSHDSPTHSWFANLFGLFIIGAAASTWAANFLRGHRPSR
jgi:tetratricopeptide (TPR) repeat protein